jgi:hypothetical protein
MRVATVWMSAGAYHAASQYEKIIFNDVPQLALMRKRSFR